MIIAKVVNGIEKNEILFLVDFDKKILLLHKELHVRGLYKFPINT